MAATTSNGDEEQITGINVTPFVDITLVLLVIFMVTAKLIVNHAVPMDLPKAASAGETQTVFAVSIDKGGRVLADGRPMKDDASLGSAAKVALHDHPDLRTVIQASRATSHGDVMHVLDELRGVGVVKVAFAADKAPSVETHAP
jgi:biopolymer transport protein ExbD